MSAVVVSLCGGLGNQLFQYAAGRSICLKQGVDLVLDVHWFHHVRGSRNITERRFGLGHFGLPHGARIINDSDVIRDGLSWTLSRSRITLKILERLRAARDIDREHGLGDIPTYRETLFGYEPDLINVQPPIRLVGYWQSYRYLQTFRDELVAELNVPTRVDRGSRDILDRIRVVDAVCVHVRRGDFLTNPSASQAHECLDVRYYRAAFDRAVEGLANPVAFVFSDDPNWARSNIRFDCETIFVDNNSVWDVHQDLWLMAACRRFVLANSTLSWWAAWLSRGTGNGVVAPGVWFKTKGRELDDLLPPAWIRI